MLNVLVSYCETNGAGAVDVRKGEEYSCFLVLDDVVDMARERNSGSICEVHESGQWHEVESGGECVV